MVLKSVRLLVQQFEACYDFYKNRMGLTEQEHDNQHAFAQFELNGFTFSLYKKHLIDHSLSTLDDYEETETFPHHITFYVDNTEFDLSDLSISSVNMSEKPTILHDNALRLKTYTDPDGNKIDFVNAGLIPLLPMDDHMLLEHSHTPDFSYAISTR